MLLAENALAKRKDISLSKAEKAIMASARFGAASKLVSDGANAIGAQESLSNNKSQISLGDAMLENSSEIGLWSGIQSGTNANILHSESMGREKIVAKHEANAHGVGAVFGEYDKWNEVNNKNRNLKKKIETAEKKTKQEIENIKNNAGEIAKKEMLISEHAKQERKERETMFKKGGAKRIMHWSKDWHNLEQEKKDLAIEKEDAVNKFTNFMKHYYEYQNKHGIPAAIAKRQELLHNMQSGDQRMQEIEAKEAQLQQLHSAGVAINNAIKQNNEIYDPKAHGVVRLMNAANTAATGKEHGLHMATSLQNAMATGRFSGQVTDATGKEIRTSNVSSQQLANAKAAGTIVPLANEVIAANNMSNIYRSLYNKSGAQTQALLSKMGYGRGAIHNMLAFSGMRGTAVNSILNGEDAYATLNPETHSFGSQIFGSRHGINDVSIHNVNYGGEMVQSITGGMSISHQQTAALGVSIGKDVLKTAADVYFGRGLTGGIIKNINENKGHFADLRSAVNKVLTPKKTAGDIIEAGGDEFKEEVVNKGKSNIGE